MQEQADPFGWVGATIDGKYRIDEVVGEGGFGVVYRGYHLGFSEAVAIKCLKLAGAVSAAEREAFQSTFIEEGRILRRLSRASSGIVQAHDVGAAVSPAGVWTPYLALEWLRGVPLSRDLADRRARGDAGRPLAEAVALLAPAARALDVAHLQGVAHRDIKPANLFLAEVSGLRTLKVLDFGIAKVMGDHMSTAQALVETASSLQAFTPQYGAPEQFHRGFGATGPWTDVFALALVLIEVASGRFALEGSNMKELFGAARDVLHRPGLGSAGVAAPAAVEAALERAVSIDPSERYRTAGELWDALEAAMHDQVALGYAGTVPAHRLAQPSSGKEPPFCVPFFQNPGFVGRAKDLEALHEHLQQGETVGLRPAALTGMGGVGKTQLAVEYAYRYRDAYPGGVYWLNAAESWQGELALLAEKVGLREDSAPEADRQRLLSLAFVKYLDEHPGALMIFDNVEDPRRLRTPLHGIIPAQLRCRLLFTTRRRDSAGTFTLIEVGVLPEAESLDLLLSSEERRPIPGAAGEGQIAAARAICRMLGNLPLALALAGAYLGQNPEIPLFDFSDRLALEGALVAVDDSGVAQEDMPTRHAAAVQATLELQWKALTGDAERDVLRTAALLGEAAEIPRARLALLTGLRDRAEKGRAAPLAAALRRLRDLSLVEDLTAQAIRLHPLVREFAEKQIDATQAFADTCAARLCGSLWDMGRLHEEVVARGIDAVLEDLRVGKRLSGAIGARLDRLMRPLDREAHCLRGWDPDREPGFLLQQLRNRSFELEIQDVQRATEAKLDERGWQHLRERIRTSRESEALARTLEGHTHIVSSVAVTPDGRFAVSASWDKTLKVWELSTGQCIRTLQGHADRVNSVAVTPDGNFAVSASCDRFIKVWELSTGRTIRTLEGHTSWVNCVAITPDGRFSVSASDDVTLKLWELSTGRAVHTLHGHTNWVRLHRDTS